MSVCAFNVQKQKKKSMQSVKRGFGCVYSTILSAWKFECALQLQCTKTVSFRYVRHPMPLFMLFMLFCHSKIQFHQSEPFQMIKTMLKSFHVLLGLSPVWGRYPNGGHTTGATKRSIITYDEIKDMQRICD